MTQALTLVLLLCMVCTLAHCEDWTPDELPPTSGRNLFVAAQAAGADDANDGTFAHPLRTITRAAALAQPGDTVWVREGTYRETATVDKSGEGPGRMLAFRAFPGERPVIKGSELLSGWRRAPSEPDRPIWEADWPWEGVYPSLICADDSPLLPFSIPPETEALKPPDAYCQYFLGHGRGQAAMVPGSFCYDAPRRKLLVWLKGDEAPTDHTMEAAIRACCWVSSGDYIRVEGLAFSQCALVVPVGGVAFVMTGPGGGASPAEGCIVRNCEASLSAFEGMVVRGGKRVSTLVEDCWIHHNGNGAGSFEGQGDPDTDSWMHVRRCRLTDNNLFNWNSSWHAGGKHIGNRVYFDRCQFLRAYNSPGLWFDCHTRDCVVDRCYAAGNGQFNLYYEIGETGAFLNNVVEGSPHCCAIALNGSSRTLVAHNMVAATERGIIAGWEANAEGQVARVTCYNWLIGNVLTGRSYPLVSVSPERDIAHGNASDHNLLWQTPPTAWQTPGDGGYFESSFGDLPSLDLVDWQQRRALDLHSRIADPLVTVTNGRFGRLPGSPATTGGKRLGLAEVRDVFALRDMPAVESDVGSASIRDHLPASEAFIRKVAQLLEQPVAADVSVGPLPDEEASRTVPVPLADPGFDDSPLPQGATGPLPEGWTNTGPAHLWHAAGTGLWNWPPPSGDSVLVLPAGAEEAASVSQVTASRPRPGTRYRLSAWFGQRSDQADLPWPSVTLSLWAGSRRLCAVNVPEPQARPYHGVWVESTSIFEPFDGRLPDALMRVEILRSGPATADVCVDDVSLTAEEYVPPRIEGARPAVGAIRWDAK